MSESSILLILDFADDKDFVKTSTKHQNLLSKNAKNEISQFIKSRNKRFLHNTSDTTEKMNEDERTKEHQ